MVDLDWLIARPLAHRGLHDDQNRIIENTPSAFAAAIAARYGIECDLQISSDGEAMVYHDDTLGRLTETSGRLDAMTAAELKRVTFRATRDRMMTFGELCDFVAGGAALLIELKSPRAGDRLLATRAAKVLSGYAGQAAVMSFEPAQIVELRRAAPRLPRGMAVRKHAWSDAFAAPRRSMAALAHVLTARPQFVAYSVSNLPALLPALTRSVFGLPLLAWTVRSADDREKAARYADQMIFEGFRP
ncbi:MAG: glycerophosphodiester phosphodiesterase family protein [Xanthobacteraceae bacterium]